MENPPKKSLEELESALEICSSYIEVLKFENTNLKEENRRYLNTMQTSK